MASGVKQRINAIINGHGTEQDTSFLTQGLYGLSRVYRAGIWLRSQAYSRGILRSRHLPCRVVSIGNITAGGTGKTPMALYVAERLKALRYRVALVSRGYQGAFEKCGGVVRDGSGIVCTPAQSGDEPYMLAEQLQVPVVVGRNRYRSGMAAVHRFSPEVIVMDDGFQHRALHRDLDLVLLDSEHPFGNGHFLPRGRLRDLPASLAGSDAVILTRCRQSDRPAPIPKAVMQLAGDRPVFKTCHEPVIVRMPVQALASDPGCPDSGSGGQACRMGLLVSGVADNSDVLSSCRNLGIRIADHVEFPDHYWYKQEDFEKIRAAMQRSSAEIIVTTEKDHVKLKALIPDDMPMIVIGVRIRFIRGDGIRFDRWLERRVAFFRTGDI